MAIWPFLGKPKKPTVELHTHTHTRLTALCLGLPGWAGTRKIKPIWILLKQETVSGSVHMQVCTSLQTDNHASTPPLIFFTGRMPFLPPNQQCQSTEGKSSSISWLYIDYEGWLMQLFCLAICHLSWQLERLPSFFIHLQLLDHRSPWCPTSLLHIQDREEWKTRSDCLTYWKRTLEYSSWNSSYVCVSLLGAFY